MAGPVANLCLEDHMRNLIRDGFETVMVRDAVAAAGKRGRLRPGRRNDQLAFHGQRGVDHGRDRAPDGRSGQGSRLKSTRPERAVAEATNIEHRAPRAAEISSCASSQQHQQARA